MYKRDERLRHLYITSIRFLADDLYRRGVKKLYIGYPYMLSQDNGNEYNANTWWFRKIVLWIVDIFMEHGIDVEIVPEDYTSQRCSICGVKHKKGRVYRGLYMQEDWEEDQCRYKRCAEHSKKAGTQDKDS